MWRSIASNALTLGIVLIAGIGALIGWGQREFVSEGPLDSAICLRVERGASLADVSGELAAQGAIRNEAIFRAGARYTDRAGALRFGSYLVPEGASMDGILDIVTRGGASTCGSELVYRIGVTRTDLQLRTVDPATGRFAEQAAVVIGEEITLPEEIEAAAAEADTRFRVLVVEGSTAWQVWDSLRRAPFLTGEVGARPAEGSLAPDSYEVRPGQDRAELLALMAERQARILADLWAARAERLPLETPEDALILASIIEKETGVADERRTIAGVFINRLNRGMRLQTDPTVIYGVTLGEGVLGRGLRQSELRAATPYNTYVISGLPPTPIANPGRASIEAALNPETTPYIFFVADGTGGHAFAATLDEHNRNVAAWRQIERERGLR